MYILSICVILVISANCDTNDDDNTQLLKPTIEPLSARGFTARWVANIVHLNNTRWALKSFGGTLKRASDRQQFYFVGPISPCRIGKYVGCFFDNNTIISPGDTFNYWIKLSAFSLYELSYEVPTDRNPIYHSNSETFLSYPRGSKQPCSIPIHPGPKDSCTLSRTRVRGFAVCQGDLIFDENFDKLDWCRWQAEVKIPRETEDADFVSFQNRPENCYVQDGQLRIVPSLISDLPGYDETKIRYGEMDLGPSCTATVDAEKECRRKTQAFQILSPIVSARIRSRDSFSFQYGRIEVRAKMPKGDWLFPQILLEPLTHAYGINGYASGQIRIAFIRANELLMNSTNSIGGNRLYGGAVYRTGEQFRERGLRSLEYDEHLGNAFHTYSLTWTEDSIQVALDGVTYGTINERFSSYSSSPIAPFDQEFYITLGVSAGGLSDFPDNSETQKPWLNYELKGELKFWNDRNNWHRTWKGIDAGMLVDYVKVWAL